MYAIKRRASCLCVLLLISIASFIDLKARHDTSFAPSILGLSSGLLLGIIHIPEAGVVRDVSRSCKLAFCSTLSILTLYAATYPWHMIPSFGAHHQMRKRLLMLIVLFVTAGVYMLCILKEHPPSIYAHDAKWCIFGIWLSTMAYQGYEAAKAYESRFYGDFALAGGISLDSVVLGWILVLFQARMRVLQSGSLGCLYGSKFWIYVMCGAFIANSVSVTIQRAWSNTVGMVLSLVVRSIFLAIWLVYIVLVCRTLCRGLYVLWLESRRVRGLPKKQVEWAARVLRVELFICATLGATTFLVWTSVNVIKYIQLVNPQEYDRVKRNVWQYVGIFRRADGVLNAVELAFLSGILWQGRPPEEEIDMDSRSRLRALTSMSDFLMEDQQQLYHAKVEELAHRGFHLGSLPQLKKGQRRRTQECSNKVTKALLCQCWAICILFHVSWVFGFAYDGGSFGVQQEKNGRSDLITLLWYRFRYSLCVVYVFFELFALT